MSFLNFFFCSHFLGVLSLLTDSTLPSSHEPFVHEGNVLGKYFTVFITNFSHVLRKMSGWESRKCSFSGMLHFITWECFNITLKFRYSSQLCDFQEKILVHRLQSIPCSHFSVAQSAGEVQIVHNFSYLWTNKDPLFKSSLTQFWKLVTQKRESLFLSVASFNKDLCQPYFNL